MAGLARLTYDQSWYLPYKVTLNLKSDSKAVRKEYTRLRDISQKRLKRMKAAGYGDTKTYKLNAKHYPKLKDIKSDAELAQRLSDLAKFIMGNTTIYKMNKIRDKALETLHANNYTFVTKENYKQFGQFMEEYRAQKLDEQGYDSGDAAEVYGFTLKHDLDPEAVKKDFEKWLDNIEGALNLNYSQKTAGNYEAMLNRAVKKQKVIDKNR